MDTGSTVGKAARAAGSTAGSVDVEAPYTGEAGRTRLDPMLVTFPDGNVRSIQVYRAVNVGSDPKLREPTLAGGLHRFESGEELALPFVFHDPAAHKLCVVVPEALRHTVLEERAGLLGRVAKDTAHAVPAYVREATVVVGTHELGAYLSLPAVIASQAQLAQRAAEHAAHEGELRRREELIVQREERIATRGEALTRREDELRALQEEIESSQRDLTLREEELESRVDSLREREAELKSVAAAHTSAPRSASAPAVSAPPSAPLAAIPASSAPTVVTPSSVSLPAASAPVAESKSRAPAATDVEDDAEDDVEELVDEEEVAEELDELDGVESVEDTGVGPVPVASAPSTDEIVLDEAKTMIGAASVVAGVRAAVVAKVAQDAVTGATVPPPPGFLRDSEREMDVLVEEGVRLFARLDASRETAFDVGADLLVQLAMVQGYPVAILALVAAGDDARPYVRRAAIDGRDTSQRVVLDALRRHFAARVALYASDGRYLRTIEVVARREPNAALVAERASKPSDAQIDGPTACERALAAPPPVREAGHPFTLADDAPAASSAHDAATAVVRLAAWATPERIDRALLVLSVPREIVDATFRRVLEDAIDFGMGLPAALRDRAVALGLANEPGELVTRQIESFRRTASTKNQGALGTDEIAANWETLLAGAAEYEIAIDSDTHDVAWKAIRAAKGEESAAVGGGDVDLSKIAQMGPPELVLLLEHPRARRAAAIELCRRGDAELVDAVYKAVRKMPRPEVVRVAAKVVAFGEAAGDVLIDGLTARKTFVRQASAVALGQLKLRRAVVPLLHLLQSEESGVWKEVARVLGELGQASYRPLLRAAKEPKSPEDRFAYALAHAANAGSRKALQAVAKDPSEGERLMRVAQQAIVLEDEAKRDAQEVRGERAYEGGDPVKSFSRRFYQELTGTAPEGDLDDV